MLLISIVLVRIRLVFSKMSSEEMAKNINSVTIIIILRGNYSIKK